MTGTPVVPMLSALGRAAVAYAERGWYVFPLQPRGKTPLIKGGGGFLAATCDVAQVVEWWTRYPNANIGLWPGQSGFVVLDLDGPEGAEAAGKIGALSEPTLECSTGRPDGGRHLYFDRPVMQVSNCDLAPKLDVRGDAGYVVIPPSIHPTGTPYRWLGRIDDVRPLPPGVLSALQAAQDRAESEAIEREEGGPDALVVGNRSARDIAFEEELGEGGRNNALTRYAGRLLAKGMSEEETLALVSALNVAKCRPALPSREVNALVASVALREARKRAAVGGVESPDVPDIRDIPSPAAIGAQQVAEARALLTRDVSRAPRWMWRELDGLVGAMMPGDLVVCGSLMGNGKSTLLMSQMDAFAACRIPTLYIPLEVDPAVNRLRWAAWKLGLNVVHVIRQEWAALPEGAREAVDYALEEQEQDPFVHFAPPKRMTLPSMIQWCRWAREEFGAEVIMLDHLHRMDFGGTAAGHRVAVTEAVRQLKDMARDLGVVLIAAAQLNRTNDALDRYIPPGLSRLKESAGIAEEADVVLMLSRRLRSDLPEAWEKRLRLGEVNENDLAEPGTMLVTCRKHRLDGAALDHGVALEVVNGRLQSRMPRLYQPPPGPPPTRTAHADHYTDTRGAA